MPWRERPELPGTPMWPTWYGAWMLVLRRQTMQGWFGRRVSHRTMQKAHHATEEAMSSGCQPASTSVKKWKGCRRWDAWEFAWWRTTVMVHERLVIVVVIRGPFGDVNAGGRSVAERNRPSSCFVAAAADRAAASFGERMLVP
jgi:hypothetical protein